MIDIVSNNDSMDNLAMKDLTLMEHFGFLGVENLEEGALSSENKKSPCPGAVKFQGGDGIQQVIMLVTVRKRVSQCNWKRCRYLP
jgi:hypothetical protein